MRSLAFVVLAFSLAACGDPGGVITGVTPSTLLVGRSAEIEITGEGTSFSSGTRAGLGPGVRVGEVTAVSATTLRVRVEVATGAEPGARDLVVDDLGALPAALAIEPPVEVKIEGPTVRGSIAAASLVRRDPSHGFTDAIAVAASPGLTWSITSVTADRIDALLAIDASAPLGLADLEVRVGTGDALVRFPSPGAFEITEAAAIPTLQESAEVTLSAPYASSMWWVGPQSELALVEIDASATPAEPALVLLDEAGRFPRDFATGVSRIREIIDGPRGVVLRDVHGAAGAYALTAHRCPLRAVPATGQHHAIATAILLGGPDVLAVDASMGSASDADFYAVDLPVGAVGQRLHVETLPGDVATDTRVTLILDDQITTFGSSSRDLGAHDELTSPTIARAGRYYIRVGKGSAFDAAHGAYRLLVVMR